MGTFRMLAAMAWRNLWSHWGKNALVGLLILFGTFLVVLGTSVLDGIDKAMARSITQSVSGHLQVYSRDARDDLALFGSGFMGADDLGVMTDFSRVKAAIETVPGVKAVLPMGMDVFDIYSASELDHAIERLRKSYEAGDQAGAALVATRIRAMADLLRQELQRRKKTMRDHEKLDKYIALVDRVRTDEFWAVVHQRRWWTKTRATSCRSSAPTCTSSPSTSASSSWSRARCPRWGSGGC